MLPERHLSPLPDPAVPHSPSTTARTIFTQRANAVVPLHWLSTAAAFSGTGGLVSGDDLADLIRHRCEVAGWLPDSEPVSLVARWIVTRAVVSLDSPWGPMFPLFQFDLPGPTVAAQPQSVVAELGRNFDGWALASWFVEPNAWLANQRPIESLASHLPDVLEAARADRFVRTG